MTAKVYSLVYPDFLPSSLSSPFTRFTTTRNASFEFLQMLMARSVRARHSCCCVGSVAAEHNAKREQNSRVYKLWPVTNSRQSQRHEFGRRMHFTISDTLWKLLPELSVTETGLLYSSCNFPRLLLSYKVDVKTFRGRLSIRSHSLARLPTFIVFACTINVYLFPPTPFCKGLSSPPQTSLAAKRASE